MFTIKHALNSVSEAQPKVHEHPSKKSFIIFGQHKAEKPQGTVRRQLPRGGEKLQNRLYGMVPLGGYDQVSKLYLYDPLARMVFVFLSLKRKRRGICDRNHMRPVKSKIFTTLRFIKNLLARKIERYTDMVIHQISCWLLQVATSSFYFPLCAFLYAPNFLQ